MKDKYIQYLKLISEICQRNDIPDEIKIEVDKLNTEIENFKLKIPLVGGFNAGKSSLINKFLGEKVLPEEITPETAIASEIKYGPTMIVAYRIDGTTMKYPINEIKNLDAKEFKYIEIFLDNEKLKRLDKDVVIVDMPGFDSKIEDHNKAILQYLDNGVAFILVMDCEDGCLKSSLLTFLYELSSYQLNFGVMVNKVDKKISSEIDSIVETVKRTVGPICSNAYVETASIFNDDTPDKFENIIKSFDKKEILKKYFQERILNVCSRMISALNILVKNSDVNVDDINRKINDIEAKILELDKTVKREDVVITNKLHTQTKENILNDIKLCLLNNSTVLASAILEGEYVFTSKLNELLRPVLINATSNNLEPLFNGLIGNISAEMEDLTDIAQDIKGKLANGISAAEGISKNLEVIKNNAELFNKFEKYYKIATGGLAIMTGVVAPWLELIIVFLPDILNLFGAISGNSKQEKIREKVERDIIPQVIDKLRPEVEKSLEVIKHDFMNDLMNDIQSKKADLENGLNQAIQMKKMKTEEFDSKIEEMKNDIEELMKVVEIITRG